MKGKIVFGECVWHHNKSRIMKQTYLFPTVLLTRFTGNITYEKGSWTLDIIWLKLYITFGYIIEKYKL